MRSLVAIVENQNHLRLSDSSHFRPGHFPFHMAAKCLPDARLAHRRGGLRLIRFRRRVTVAKMFSIVFTLNKRQTISFLKRQIKQKLSGGGAGKGCRKELPPTTAGGCVLGWVSEWVKGRTSDNKTKVDYWLSSAQTTACMCEGLCLFAQCKAAQRTLSGSRRNLCIMSYNAL